MLRALVWSTLHHFFLYDMTTFHVSKLKKLLSIHHLFHDQVIVSPKFRNLSKNKKINIKMYSEFQKGEGVPFTKAILGLGALWGGHEWDQNALLHDNIVLISIGLCHIHASTTMSVIIVNSFFNFFLFKYPLS